MGTLTLRSTIVFTLGLLIMSGCGRSDRGGPSGPVASSTAPAAVATASAAPEASASAIASASASATTTPDDDEPPPSTGKEMPKGQPGPDESESAKIWRETIALAANAPTGKLKCFRVVSPKIRLALTKAPPDAAEVKTNMKAYLRVARCAESLSSWGFLREIGTVMNKADPIGGHPELVARALLGKRLPEAALSMLERTTKKLPQDANVANTFAKIYCGMLRWSDCKAAGENAIAFADKETDENEKRRIIAGANKYIARALAHTGALDEAEQKIDEAERLKGKKVDIEDIRGEIQMARANATIVDLDPDTEVLLGTYHLLGKIRNFQPVLRVSVENLASTDERYRVDVEIQGVTQAVTETVTVGKKGVKRLEINPALRGDFDPSKIRSPEQSSISVKITKLKKGGDELVLQQSVKTTLHPRDYLPMGEFEDATQLTLKIDRRFVAAWVTPNDKDVDVFLKEAKKKLKKGQSFSGEQSATMPQVQALFETLRQRGVSYVMDPEALTKDVRAQRTRLPAEVLASTNAQCLEGAILYATLLEALKIKAMVVYVPGHAFVAWKPSPKDNTKEEYFFLETTMTGGSAPFEKAVERGAAAYAEHAATKKAQIVDIGALRKDGITPQPAQFVSKP